jgi:hypothetical protein
MRVNCASVRGVVSICALVAASIVAASPAHALTALYTPVSGAAFQPLDLASAASVVHVQGAVTNNSFNTIKVAASLGRSGGGPNTFKVFGLNRGGPLKCTISPRIGTSSFINPPVSATTTVNGPFVLPISLDFLGGGAVVFYPIECELPPGASIRGVSTGNDRFFPVSGSSFVASNGAAQPLREFGLLQNTSAQAITYEASVGRGNIAMTFDIRVRGNGGQFNCAVIQTDDLGLLASSPNFGLVASPVGLATLSIPVNAVGTSFYTVTCRVPAFNGQAAQILGVSEVGSAQNLFSPFTGAAFMPINYTTPGLVIASGSLKNPTTGFLTTEVSLGHAQGGRNGFLVYGRSTGPGVSCIITARSLTNGDTFTTSSQSFFGSGPFTLTVSINPPSGARYFYTMRCDVGPGTEIDGVRPDA